MHESWKTDFQEQITQKLDNFWTEHADDYRAAVKGQFIFKAREQLKAAEHATPADRAALLHQFGRADLHPARGLRQNARAPGESGVNPGSFPVTTCLCRGRAPAAVVVHPSRHAAG